MQPTFNNLGGASLPPDHGANGNGSASHNGNGVATGTIRLSELGEGQNAVVDALQLPQELAARLMELGFVPGHAVLAGRSAPGGDPRIFRVDGSQIALRRETTSQIFVKTDR
jgi:ferrous iron transport protein A